MFFVSISNELVRRSHPATRLEIHPVMYRDQIPSRRLSKFYCCCYYSHSCSLLSSTYFTSTKPITLRSLLLYSNYSYSYYQSYCYTHYYYATKYLYFTPTPPQTTGYGRLSPGHQGGSDGGQGQGDCGSQGLCQGMLTSDAYFPSCTLLLLLNCFVQGEFVVEYAGDLIDIDDAKVNLYINTSLFDGVLFRTARLVTRWTSARAVTCITSNTRASSIGGSGCPEFGGNGVLAVLTPLPRVGGMEGC